MGKLNYEAWWFAQTCRDMFRAWLYSTVDSMSNSKLSTNIKQVQVIHYKFPFKTTAQKTNVKVLSDFQTSISSRVNDISLLKTVFSIGCRIHGWPSKRLLKGVHCYLFPTIFASATPCCCLCVRNTVDHPSRNNESTRLPLWCGNLLGYWIEFW